MRLKVYFLRIALATVTFVFGVGLFSAGQYLKSFFETKPPEAAVAVDKQEVVQVVPVTDKTAQTEEIPEEDYGNGGIYEVIDDLPDEFADFSSIEIIDRDFETVGKEYPYGKPIPPEGFLETKQTYKLRRISVSRQKLSFETETKKGISYKFAGEFTDDHETSAILKGRLTKMRDGKKIADGDFRFVAGGC